MAGSSQAGIELLAEYTFEDDTTADSSGNGFDGILGNGAYANGGFLILYGGGFMDLPDSFSPFNPFNGWQDYRIEIDFVATTPAILISSARDINNYSYDQYEDFHSMAVFLKDVELAVNFDIFTVGYSGAYGFPLNGCLHHVDIVYTAGQGTAVILDGFTIDCGGDYFPYTIPNIIEDTVRVGGSLNSQFPYEELPDPNTWEYKIDTLRIYADPEPIVPSGHNIVPWGNTLSPPYVPEGHYVPEGSDFESVSAGPEWALALKSDGTLAAWGDNDFGRCVVPDGNNFEAISAGFYHGLALKSDRSLVAWGDDYQDKVSDTPTGNDFIAISAGYHHSLALKNDGSLVSWGDDSEGQVSNTPDGNDFIAISTRYNHSLALKNDGSLVDWGDNSVGQLSGTPTGNNFVAISAGESHNLALKDDGSLAAWGDDYQGKVSDMPGSNDFMAISGGFDFSLALKTNGTLKAWGYNDDGQCDVPDGNAFIDISAGWGYGLTLAPGVATLTLQAEPNEMNCALEPSIGNHYCYLGEKVDIEAPSCPNCPDVYYVGDVNDQYYGYWLGDVDDPNSALTYVEMDADKAVTAIYALGIRECGDICHPILQGDLNEDCITDFNDFAIYAEQWLKCTKPECDEDYEEYQQRINGQ